jgi:hypothetical protein
MEDEMARNSLLLDQAVESGEKKKSRKKLIVGLAMLGVIPVFGSTLAASISLGSGAIEFGQGARLVAACDSDGMGVELTSSFVNGASPSAAGSFKLATVKLTGVDTTNCNGKTFTVTVRNASGTSQGAVVFKLDSSVTTSGAAGIAASPAITSNWAGNVASNDITLTHSGTAITTVEEITLETN